MSSRWVMCIVVISLVFYYQLSFQSHPERWWLAYLHGSWDPRSWRNSQYRQRSTEALDWRQDSWWLFQHRRLLMAGWDHWCPRWRAFCPYQRWLYIYHLEKWTHSLSWPHWPWRNTWQWRWCSRFWVFRPNRQWRSMVVISFIFKDWQ